MDIARHHKSLHINLGKLLLLRYSQINNLLYLASPFLIAPSTFFHRVVLSLLRRNCIAFAALFNSLGSVFQNTPGFCHGTNHQGIPRSEYFIIQQRADTLDYERFPAVFRGLICSSLLKNLRGFMPISLATVSEFLFILRMFLPSKFPFCVTL